MARDEQWTGIPADMPHECPDCKRAFNFRLNFSSVHHPCREALQRGAAVVFFLWAPVLLYLLFSGKLVLPMMGTGSGYTILFLFALPSLILLGLGALFPRRRQVECLKCGWSMTAPYRRRDAVPKPYVKPHHPGQGTPPGDKSQYRAFVP